MKNIVIFDDECAVCNWSFQFVTNRMSLKKPFYFTGRNSALAAKLFKQYGIDSPPESLSVIVQNHIYFKSRAVWAILRTMGGMYKIPGILGRLIPVMIADKLYDVFARNRYKWFGKKTSCIYNPESAKYFIS